LSVVRGPLSVANATDDWQRTTDRWTWYWLSKS